MAKGPDWERTKRLIRPHLLPVDRIESVDVPPSSFRTRTVTLAMKTGGTVSLMMPADRALRFREQLTEALASGR